MKTKHIKYKNNNKKEKRRHKNNKTKNIRNRRNKRHKHNNKTNKIGGDLTDNCKADPSKFPKCGSEGCVYLNNNNEVTKQQWKTNNQIMQHLLSVDGQINGSAGFNDGLCIWDLTNDSLFRQRINKNRILYHHFQSAGF